ncbi:uncharacterized protein LOC118478670 [Aplysia californica]|uniref:Uncharacterized protein LOC118478670 n=1 Tax=Aplysia californica TaxID=6500 RepID=A0ABM1W1R0_APLCA|nr:uncharacterized protein LOC118478670 [Aplysia californica]
MQGIVACALFRSLDSYRRRNISSKLSAKSTKKTNEKGVKLTPGEYEYDVTVELLPGNSPEETTQAVIPKKTSSDNNLVTSLYEEHFSKTSSKREKFITNPARSYLMRDNQKGSSMTISDFCGHRTEEQCHCVYRILPQGASDDVKQGQGDLVASSVLPGSCSGDLTPCRRQRSQTVNDAMADFGRATRHKNHPFPHGAVQRKAESLEWLRNLNITPVLIASTISISDGNSHHSSEGKDHNHHQSYPCQNDTTNSKLFTNSQAHPNKRISKIPQILKTVIKSIFDFSVLKDWQCFSNLTAYVLARCGMFIAIYLPAYAVKSGISESRAALLVTIYGVLDMFSRICFGYIGDFHLIRPKYIISICSALMAMFCCLGELFDTFETLVFFSVMLGILGTVTLSLNTNNIVDMVGIERLGALLSLGSLLLSLSLSMQFPLLGESLSSLSS